MISIKSLAKELDTTEERILDRVVSLQLKLRARGKSLDDADAETLRAAHAAPEPEATPEAEPEVVLEAEETEPDPVVEVPVPRPASRQATPSPERKAEPKAGAEPKELVAIPLVISIKEFAERLEASPADILKILMQNGIITNLNAEIDFDTAAIMADELGFEAVEEQTHLDEDIAEVIGTDNRLQAILEGEDPTKLQSRPPVITIMGHVDHGKTSLLDSIRSTNVTAGEQGGITQHIGAYQVTRNDRKITFLDTPGHEAFTAMRARGAQVTDIAVLVVAADDGVMPQTIEALDHAKAAEVKIIVAVNKIDKPGADVERVKRELSEHGLMAEDWGGSTIFVPLSAKTGAGIEDLLEMILLVADIDDKKANPDRAAIGTVLEAKKTMHKGILTSVLIQSGTLRVGDPILVGSVAGRVKAMQNDQGKKVNAVGPAMPAEILGLSDVPEAGDILQVVDDERTAVQLAAVIQRKERAERLRPSNKISLESFYEQQHGLEVKTLNLIVKADLQGSVEAIHDSLKKMETDEVKVRIVHSGTGDVSASDITLAAASTAVVIAFNVKIAPPAQAIVQQVGVDVRSYTIIYKLLEDVQKAMGGLLSPEDIVIIQGRLDVKAIFSENRDRYTLGGFVSAGKLTQRAVVRVRRGDEVVGEAEILSLRRESTEVTVVNQGVECGMMLKKVRKPIKKGDFLEICRIEKRERTL